MNKLFLKAFNEKIDCKAIKWYSMLVASGRESEIKNACVNHEKLGVVESLSMENDNVENDLSGYVFLKMKMNLVKFVTITNMDNIIRFIGKSFVRGTIETYIPDVISEPDINKIRNCITVGGKKKSGKLKINDEVIIKEGDLASIKGKIVEIKKRKIKIIPESFFGKAIKVSINNVEKVE